MRKTTLEKTSKLPLYISIFIALIGVLLIYTLTNRFSNTNTPVTTSTPVIEENPNNIYKATPNEATLQKYTSEKNPKDKTPKETQTYQQGQEPSQKTPDKSTANSTTQNTILNLGCSADLQQPCVIKQDDPLYDLFGQSPGSELLVNGIKVRPDKILYQTSQNAFNDEQMKDGQGNILSSSKKDYDMGTKTLTITIGINSDYSNKLKPTEQRLLYLSQTVRSFMAMFGDSPEDFVKMEQVVGSMGSWQPKP